MKAFLKCVGIAILSSSLAITTAVAQESTAAPLVPTFSVNQPPGMAAQPASPNLAPASQMTMPVPPAAPTAPMAPPATEYASPYPLYDIFPDRKRSTDVIRSEDLKQTTGFPKIKLTGFFQADAGYFAQDAASIATFGNVQDDHGFRRARLAAVGDVADNVSYMLEMDFAFPGRPSFMDVWLDVHKIPILGNVRVGQYRMPFGMDELTSVRELQFLERSITFGMAPFRQFGAGFHDTNEEKTATWAGAGFAYPTDFWGDALGDRGYGFAGRLTAIPIYDADSNAVLHLGADYSLLKTGTNGLYFIRNQPEYGGPFGGPAGNSAPTTIPFFVNTGNLSANTSNLLDGEIAMSYGSWYAQSEVRYAIVQLTNGNFVTFPSAYAQMGYFLTGEKRPYDKNNAVFGRVKPLANFGDSGGMGAWEIAGRYSYMNLNSFQNAVVGNELSDITIGINWYLNQYTKFQFNYIHAFVNNVTNGSTNTDIVALRAQIDF